VALVLGLIPLVLYTATYVRFYQLHGLNVSALVNRQLDIARFHEDFANPHIQGSRAPGWPILIKPFHLYRDFTTGPDSNLPDNTGALGPGGREIVDLGNPALWYGWLLAAPFLLVTAIRRRSVADGGILGAYFFLYAPWLAIPRDQFIWYMLPAVPVMALGTVAALRALPTGRIRQLVSRTYLIVVLLAAIFFAPLWLNIIVPTAWNERLYWLQDWRYAPSLMSDSTPHT
jgi:hypothetical protein